MERTVSTRLRTPIIKPLEEFLTFTDGEHGYNAETWWEALGNTGYLTRTTGSSSAVIHPLMGTGSGRGASAGAFPGTRVRADTRSG
jgi:hypothetical protein